MKSKSELEPIIERWCDALESGAYEQGKGSLNKGNCFCCLGVLCDLLKNEFALELTQDDGETLYNGSSGFLPGDIIDELGMDKVGLFYKDNGIYVVEMGNKRFADLAGANDDGVPFPEIAAAIRANKHLLFKAYREGDAQ